MGRRYAFVSRWALPAGADACWTEIERMLRPGGAGPAWWPAVSVQPPPPALRPGEQLTLAVRSPLGYRLRVDLTLTAVRAGDSLEATSRGDLHGRGSLVLEPGESGCVLAFRWEVETTRGWMNATVWALRPAFERAHARVMADGERGLRRALASASASA